MRKIGAVFGAIFSKWHKFVTYCIGCYNTRRCHCSRDSYISGDTDIAHPENIYIGEKSFINGGQIFAGKNSKLVIGDNCMISYNTHIRTTYHNYKSREVAMNMQGMSEADIIIEDNVFIGHSVHIMAGVTVHSGSVIGANSVVCHDVPPDTVVGGVPARTISTLA